jgi:hypothetical protein
VFTMKYAKELSVASSPPPPHPASPPPPSLSLPTPAKLAPPPPSSARPRKREVRYNFGDGNNSNLVDFLCALFTSRRIGGWRRMTRYGTPRRR